MNKITEQIWEKANKYIVDNEYSPKKIISLSNVDVVCTTDSPLDDLKWHKEIKDTNFKTNVVPGFRPDESLSIGTAKFDNFIIKIAEIVWF